MIGRAVAHYRIIKSIGAGGMGEVYLAEDLTLGRHVALKILPEKHTQNRERLRRFKQEAKSASALNHPNILTIYEVGEADGHHFIATEFVDGETLRASLKRAGKMTAADALQVAVQVASALAAAHEAGIVHRDVKPENIMLRRDGYVKVLDFGLAKLTETPAANPTDDSVSTISAPAHTESGVILGTSYYMSPEQATGKDLDGRSDIFSFGAVLYEVVTGERAFPGASLVEILASILNQEPKSLPADISPDLVKIILRCLRKDPARRFQSMADLKVAIEDLREESDSRAKSKLSIPLWNRRNTAILLVFVLALLGYYLWQNAGTRPAESLRAATLTTLPGIEHSPTLSADGKHVAFSWAGANQENEDIYVQMIGSNSPLRLTTNPLNDYNPAWSPDGRWIAFLRSQPPAPTGLRSRELIIIPPLGGAERKLADIRGQDFLASKYLAWTADSNALVVTDSLGEGKPDALFAVSLESGEKRRVTDPQPPVLADTSPAVSPDGRSLVFLRRTTWGAGELQMLLLDENFIPRRQPRRLTHIDLRADSPAWLPNNKEILFSARKNLWRLAVSGNKEPERIPYVGEDGLMPALSQAERGKSARLVYVRSFWDSNLWRIETSAPGAPASSAPTMAISSTTWEYHCQFSPDGRRVAYSSDRSGEREIWVSDPNGENALQLTFLAAQETMCPNWSPDGQWIAFSSNREKEFDVFVVPAAGGKTRRLTSHPAIDLCPRFSPDGKSIYFNSMRSGDYRVWKMPASGGDAVQITRHNSTLGWESPDGSSIYYLDSSIVSPVWQVPINGGEPVKILDGIVWFNFFLMEKGAYYIDRAGGETRLQYFDFANRKSSIVARNLGEVSSGLTATPDGKTILFTRVDSSTDDLMLVENFQ